MQRLIFAAALGLASGSALAFGMPCDKPEYLQLKSANRTELTDEFCRAMRNHKFNLDENARRRESLVQRSRAGEHVSKEFANEDYLNAALTCSKAASKYMGALERRFKMKKRPSCN